MKKKFLRLLSSVLFLATIFSTLIATIHADSTDPLPFLMKHDFNDRTSATANIADSYVFNSWNGNSELGLAVNEYNSADQYMTWKRTTAEASPQLNLFMDADKISTDTSRSIVVSFRMNFQAFGRFKASLADVDGRWSTFFFLNDSGVMSTRADGAGDVLATLKTNKWYTVAAVVDETAKLSTVYLNGEKIGTVKAHASHTYLKRLQISFEKIAGSGLANVWLDDFYMYEGTEPRMDTGLPQSQNSLIALRGTQTTKVIDNRFDVRFVGEIIGLDAQCAGFEIGGSYGKGENITAIPMQELTTSKAYTSILADGEKVIPTKEGNYLIALNVFDIPVSEEVETVTFTVKPFIVNSNGEKRYGEEATFTFVSGK